MNSTPIKRGLLDQMIERSRAVNICPQHIRQVGDLGKQRFKHITSLLHARVDQIRAGPLCSYGGVDELHGHHRVTAQHGLLEKS